MKLLALGCAVCLSVLSYSSAAANLEIKWNEDFSLAASLKQWKGGSGEIVKDSLKGNALTITRESVGSSAVTYALPQEFLGGGELLCSAWVRWNEVSDKPQSWNGVKFMLVVETPTGKQWPQCSLPAGSSGWVEANFLADIPADATSITLQLGLEEVSGEAWFADIQVVKKTLSEEADAALRQPVLAKTHSQERLRGAMIAPASFTIEDLDVLRSWGANLMRWQLIYTGKAKGAVPTDEEYDAWLEKSLAKLDLFLPEIAKRDMLIVLDLHSPPGSFMGDNGYVTSGGLIWKDEKYQARLVRFWEEMAVRYKGKAGIWGFDLMNEPVDDSFARGVARWNGTGGDSLALRVAQAVRAIDPERTLIIEPNHWGSVSAMSSFKPLPLENVVYSPHFYIPHEFTHQGVGSNKVGVTYPGKINGVEWNKEALRKAMEPALLFQKKYNVPIYVGEFSAIRWAPEGSAYRYLKDVIEIMEEYGWDWSYHAFREWSGWSVEHGEEASDQERASTPTERQKLMMEYFQKNF